MSVRINRRNTIFEPDLSRVITRFFFPNKDRAKLLIDSILRYNENERKKIIAQVFRKFSKRHRSIQKIFVRHFRRLMPLMEEVGYDYSKFSLDTKLLIGAYFTMEYSIESAAFFNPSIIEHPDQSALGPYEKRVIISFRATGEGHVSSIVFRMGILHKDNDIEIEAPGKMLEVPVRVKSYSYQRKPFLNKLHEMCSSAGHENGEAYRLISKKLSKTFTYDELKRYLNEVANELPANLENVTVIQEANWLAQSNYEITFSLDTSISERVIFPISETEQKGIEDARFVRFVDEDGEVTYYATYTAYDGIAILPKLIKTTDFYHFKIMPLHGKIAQNKGMALFPRKVNGKYVMLCRIDGVNNYISYSDNINVWREAKLIQAPKYPWELVQIGNNGSPLETPAGWLVIIHGVGPIREYTLGASLFDLNNPEIEIGRLKEPIIIPNEQEREGYVPNVVYSCGAYINNGEVVIPYAMSDYSSTYATIDLAELLDELTGPNGELS